MGTLRFFEEVVSFKIRRTFGFADYTGRSGAKFELEHIRIVLNGRKNLRYDKTTRIIPFDACRFVLSIHPNGSFFRKNSYLYESENRRIRKPTLEADATKRREYSAASEGGKPQISDRRGP